MTSFLKKTKGCGGTVKQNECLRRSIRPNGSLKKVLWEILQNSQENICAGFSFMINAARKTIFSVSKCSEKMIFPKKSLWNMIFHVSSRKMIFLFAKNVILFFRRKMKDDLSQKKYMEI